MKIKNFKLIQCWVVRQFKNEYNPIHWHTGHVSGAGWLKIPNDFGQTAKIKKITLMERLTLYMDLNSFYLTLEQK